MQPNPPEPPTAEEATVALNQLRNGLRWLSNGDTWPSGITNTATACLSNLETYVASVNARLAAQAEDAGQGGLF